MIYDVYSITCLANGRVYFGRSQEIGKRWRAHVNMLRKSVHNNLLLQSDWNEYGEPNFTFKIIHSTESLEESVDIEQSYIDSSAYEKYNISDAKDGGNTFTNNPRSEVTRKLKSYNTTGERNPMYGKPKSEKMISRVKEANSKPVVVEGVLYPSSVEVSKATGIKTTTINYRLQSKSPRFKDWNYA